MKKYLALVLGMMFVLGFAAQSFAFHAEIPSETTGVVAAKDVQIELSGELRIRGWYEDNITNATGTAKATTGRPYKGGSMSWYDQRVRLALDAKVGDNVSGRVHLETAGENWNWGTQNNTAVGNGNFAGGGVGLNILEAWLAYTGKGLLGVTSGIKAGHMPVVIGAGAFFDHRRRGDDAIVLFIEPAKGTEIHLATVKLFEDVNTKNADDIDLYSLMATHKVGDNTVGANYSYVMSNDDDDANLANDDMELHNIGLFVRGKVAGLGYKASADIQRGSVNTGPKNKFRGYGVTAGVDYKVDPVTVRGNFVYGSGDSGVNDAGDEAKIKTFQTFVGNVIDPNLPTVVYNWRVITAAGALGTGIANTHAYNIGATVSPVKDLSLALDFYYLLASKRLTKTKGALGYQKKIGSEVDLKLSYKVAKNLTYAINSGVLFANDNFYEAGTKDAKNAVVLQHQLVLSF